MPYTPYIVGITGGSGSGKTAFLHRLVQSFSAEQVCLVSQDNYYRSLSEQHLDENGIHNFDIPQAINQTLYAQHILALRNGETIQQPEYTFNNPAVVPKILTFQPAPIIVVEGIFVFYFEEIANILDLKVFIDTQEHLKLTRRIVRDNTERGYDLTDVLYRYEHHAAPAYEKYIRPFKSKADLIIPNNHLFENALSVIVAFLQSKLP